MKYLIIVDKYGYINELSNARVVEKTILNYTHHRKLTYDLQDLCQMIYLILLEYDDNSICNMCKRGEINNFIVGIIKKQYDSKTSPYFKQIVKPNIMTEDLSNVRAKEDND